MVSVPSGRSTLTGEHRRAARPPPSPIVPPCAAGAGDPPKSWGESVRLPSRARTVGQPFRTTRPNPTANPVGGTWKESPPLASSHRKSRPTGTRVAGIRTPAFATAALRLRRPALPDRRRRARAPPRRPTTGRASRRSRRRSTTSTTRPSRPPTQYNAAKEKAAKQQSRVDALLDDVAQRTQKLNDAREELGSFAAAQYRTGSATPDTTTTFLLADDPQDYFDQNQLMDRLTARQKDAVDDYVTQQAETTQKRAGGRRRASSRSPSRRTTLQTTKPPSRRSSREARRLLSKPDRRGEGAARGDRAEEAGGGPRKAQELARQQQAAEQQRPAGSRVAAVDGRHRPRTRRRRRLRTPRTPPRPRRS